MKLTWTRRGSREFNKAFADMYQANPQAALRWHEDATGMMAMIEMYPRIGHMHRQDPDGEVREVIVGRYRFIYLLAETVEIRRVRHVRRDYNPQTIRDRPASSHVFASY